MAITVDIRYFHEIQHNNRKIASTGYFTFWISPSLMGIAEQNRCNSQASMSN